MLAGFGSYELLLCEVELPGGTHRQALAGIASLFPGSVELRTIYPSSNVASNTATAVDGERPADTAAYTPNSRSATRRQSN
jgi:hypothetical protein